MHFGIHRPRQPSVPAVSSKSTVINSCPLRGCFALLLRFSGKAHDIFHQLDKLTDWRRINSHASDSHICWMFVLWCELWTSIIRFLFNILGFYSILILIKFLFDTHRLYQTNINKVKIKKNVVHISFMYFTPFVFPNI